MLHGAKDDRSAEYSIGMNRNITKLDSDTKKIRAINQGGGMKFSLALGTQAMSAAGGITAVFSGMAMLNIELMGSRETFFQIQAAMMMSIGAMRLYSVIKSMRLNQALIEGAIAKAETAVAAAAQQHHAIATAALGAAMVVTAFAGGVAVAGLERAYGDGITNTSVTVNGVNIETPEGQMAIDDTMRQQREEVPI